MSLTNLFEYMKKFELFRILFETKNCINVLNFRFNFYFVLKDISSLYVYTLYYNILYIIIFKHYQFILYFLQL